MTITPHTTPLSPAAAAVTRCAYCHELVGRVGTWAGGLIGFYCDRVCLRLAGDEERCRVPVVYR